MSHAARTVPDPRASFAVGDARALPVADGWADAVVAGLMLDFVAQRTAALAEMRRICRSGGVVAAYVWDYAGGIGMQLISRFWSAAAGLDPAARLQAEDVIVVQTVFPDADRLWAPFLQGTGPAPA